MSEHGNPGMYRYHGCRCDECKAAAARQTLELNRRKRLAAGPTAAEVEAMTPLPGEEWRAVADSRSYEVSNLGRVRSNKFTFPRLISTVYGRAGYVRVRLWAGNKSRLFYVHRLVAAAFLGPCPEGQEVRHLDDNKEDNRLSNLAYGTRSQNVRDSVWNGTQPQTKKTHCPSGHEYTPENTYLRPKGQKGWRTCRACQRERDRLRRRGGSA